MNVKTARKRRTGCLLPLGLYLLAVVVMYFITLPAAVTDDFTGNTARIFSIATVISSQGGNQYRRTTLETVEARDEELPALVFLLPDKEITIDNGDIHHVTVLEDHDDWQLIEFDYANTYIAKSIYRAYADRIEPVSFRMVSHAGQAMLAFILIVPVYLVAWLITVIRNQRARVASRDDKV